MSSLSREALRSLTATVDSLLREGVDESAETRHPRIALLAAKISPSGLGGFVATNEDPAGDILGCRVRATLMVTINGASQAELAANGTRVTEALLGADHGHLVALGLLQLSLLETSPPRPPRTDDGSPVPAEQDLRFAVGYEYQQQPVEAGDLIREVPIEGLD